LKPPRARDALRRAISELEGAGLPAPEKEAEAIIRDGLGIDMTVLYRDNPVLSETETRLLSGILARRKNREPLQYILGWVDFYGLRIKVGPGVLIPRPETEVLVDEVLKRIGPEEAPAVLELCTGCGAVALAIKSRRPRAAVWATDISGKALQYARENASSSGLEIVFLEGDLYAPVKGKNKEKNTVFDIIVANPPYIKSSILESLPPEVKDWEPRIALEGGKDGLGFAARILEGAPAHLPARGSLVLLEIAGGSDIKELERIAAGAGLSPAGVVKDFCGLDRVFIAEL
jgi:release factor glutamine methyltransferase